MPFLAALLVVASFVPVSQLPCLNFTSGRIHPDLDSAVLNLSLILLRIIVSLILMFVGGVAHPCLKVIDQHHSRLQNQIADLRSSSYRVALKSLWNQKSQIQTSRSETL